MVINTNYSALSSGRQLGESQGMLNKSLARLSSGSKLVNPSDDAAGFAVSARFDAQINRTQAAVDNIGNAVSFSQTQDGYLKKVAKALDRMSELSLLALDETKSDTDRGLYNNEFTKLGAFVTASSTRDFNGVSMFGSSAINVTVNSEGTSNFAYSAVNLSLSSYTVATGSTITTTANASTALTNVKAAINQLATDRATVGANQAALNMYQEQLGVSKDNLTAANSRIKDVNVLTKARPLPSTTSWSRRARPCWPRLTPVRSRPSVSWAKPSGWFGPGRAASGAPRPGGVEKASLLRLQIGASERQNVLDHRELAQEVGTWTQQSVRKAGGEKTPENQSDRQARWCSGRVSKPVFLRIDFCVQHVFSNSPEGLRSFRGFCLRAGLKMGRG